MKHRDPIYVTARREMWVILGTWGVFCVWVLGYCAANGYEVDGAGLQLVFGMPAWVFWGIAVPWMSATAFSIVFAAFFMKDHALEEGDPGGRG